MQNQESPQTDQDVIDWLVENIDEKTRSRRGVIKKLKELGLIFKAPTKKSNAAATNKNVFTKDEDDKLRELYDEHRLEEDCLRRIMQVFDKKRSKKAVVKRMVQLGLIADESEIMPAKKRRNQGERDDSSESEDSDDDESPKPGPARQAISHHHINQREATSLRVELEELLKEAIEWIIESLNEAADDFEGPSDDPDDAIPIVAFTEAQKTAMENPQFQKLLVSINLQAPQGHEAYWKIPANMMPEELQRRAKLLAGEDVEDEATVPDGNQSSADENENDDDLFTRLRAQRDALMYNQSDGEDERSAPAKKAAKKVEKVGKPNTKLIQQLLPDVNAEHSGALKWIVSTLKDKARNKSSEAYDEMLLAPSSDDHKRALEDGNFREILLAVNMISPDGVESFWRIPSSLSSKELKTRAEMLEVGEETSDDEEEAQMVIKRKRKAKPQPLSDNLEINTQELKQRLAELSDSSGDDERQEPDGKNKKNVFDSSDEDGATVTNEKRKSGKRERSELDGDTPDENEMNASNNQSKRVRRIADSSDDE